MVTAVVIEFSGMRCQPLRRALSEYGGTMFSFTKADLEEFISQVISYTAKYIKIADVEFKSRVELLTEIQHKDSYAMQLLDAFIKAYREWYEYNFDEHGNGIADLPDKQKVSDLMQNRDTTRQNLLHHIRP
ncbi:TPA: hypothetical protein I7232_11590 [Vibrio vulnificus]|uniref:hypothetical protein n=2 Tax=Vibrio vulnificus TaxID=672 RepID=UPI0013EF9F7B|nr:hypothetical protein [Vibrio vulnificus]MDS1802066.1 hypothetical protein [Vibrio vulnificus]HAS6026980.1 hypothetical protein [Vibrio vulnificus]HAS6357658.1 hypothetical protein [Vibrio vulnificus]